VPSPAGLLLITTGAFSISGLDVFHVLCAVISGQSTCSRDRKGHARQLGVETDAPTPLFSLVVYHLMGEFHFP
jgi:hypothetical protein